MRFFGSLLSNNIQNDQEVNKTIIPSFLIPEHKTDIPSSLVPGQIPDNYLPKSFSLMNLP